MRGLLPSPPSVPNLPVIFSSWCLSTGTATAVISLLEVIHCKECFEETCWGTLGFEMNVEKTKVSEATVSITDYDRSKTAGDCGIFQLFG